MRGRERWVAGLAAAIILLSATATALGYTGQVEAIVGVAAQGTVTCGEPFAMTATILDAEGAPVADQSVDWTFVTKQSASDTINKTPTVTNAQGIATTTVTLGAVSGERQVRATVTAAAGSTSGDVSASGVVTQECGGLPRTSTLPADEPAGSVPVGVGLLLVLAGLAGGALILRRRA